MGSHASNHPLNRGFEYFYGFLSGGHSYFPRNYKLNDLTEVTRSWEWYNTRLLENFERIDVQDDYLTDVLTDAATGFIEEKVKANQTLCSTSLITLLRTTTGQKNTYHDSLISPTKNAALMLPCLAVLMMASVVSWKVSTQPY